MSTIDNIQNPGALKDVYDPRDHKWDAIASGNKVDIFDWNKGFQLNVPFKVKDQNGSGSCGGQAWAYYGEALEYAYKKEYEQNSAKFIYAHTGIQYNGGGSSGRENSQFVVKNGWGSEELTPSYDNGDAPSEEFMMRKSDITKEAYLEAKQNQALRYANTGRYIDSIAQAIKSNNGCVIGITGTNNGTWHSMFPKAPEVGDELWRHWAFCVGAEMIGGKKYIKIINSWGDKIGDKGYQWISEDYFNTYTPYFSDWSIWSGWTLYLKDLEIQKTQLSLIDAMKQLVSALTKKLALKNK